MHVYVCEGLEGLTAMSDEADLQATANALQLSALYCTASQPPTLLDTERTVAFCLLLATGGPSGLIYSTRVVAR